MKKYLLLTILLLSPVYLNAMSDGGGSVNAGGGETEPLIGKNSSNSCAKCCAKVVCFPCLTCDEYSLMRAENEAASAVRLAQAEKEKRAILATMQHVSPAQAAAVPVRATSQTTFSTFFGCHQKTACTWAVCFPLLVIPGCLKQFCENEDIHHQKSEKDMVQAVQDKIEFNKKMKELGYEEDKKYIHRYGHNYNPLSTATGHDWEKRYKLINNGGSSSAHMEE